MLLALEALAGPGIRRRAPAVARGGDRLASGVAQESGDALAGHRGPVNCAAFSTDGTHVVTASNDGTARVWDVRGERPSFVVLEGHQGSVLSAVVQRRRNARGHGI